MVVIIMVMVRIKKFGCGQEGDGAGAEEESLLNDSLQWRSRSEWFVGSGTRTAQEILNAVSATQVLQAELSRPRRAQRLCYLECHITRRSLKRIFYAFLEGNRRRI